MMHDEKPDISVIVPCLNEENNIRNLCDAAIAQLIKNECTYEIIVIDNGSSDATVAIVKQICAQNKHVKLIVNNSNYGQMRSPTHAIFQSRGRAVIGLAADFQDPPELITDFIQRWKSGAIIVLGTRQSERTSLVLRAIRTLGYGFFSRFADYKVVPDATGFGIYDRRVIDAVALWREPEPFFRGMLVESGFPIDTIPYHKPSRLSGETKNNLLRLVDFAITGVGASSKKLLRAPMYASALLGVLIIPTLGMLLISLKNDNIILITAVILIFEIFMVPTFLFLGLIGEQIRVISQTVRNIPLVIEKERVNFD